MHMAQSLKDKVHELDIVEKVLLTAFLIVLLLGVVSFAQENFTIESGQSDNVRGRPASGGGFSPIGRGFGGYHHD
jgi:hypothetical protein